SLGGTVTAAVESLPATTVARDRGAASPSSRTCKPGTPSRAAAIAASVEMEAVAYITPLKFSGNPSSFRSQDNVTSSSAVAAGEVRHIIALTFNAAANISPRIPGAEPLIAKYAKKAGWFQ